jgi:broad specificity phosphatase PhoE
MANQIIHLFRHAQAAHNCDANAQLHDPLLTEDGVQQARALTENYQFLNQPTLILVSPLRRCIQTVLHAFHPSFNSDIPNPLPQSPRIMALPQLQEITENPCDTGSSLDLLKAEFGEYVEFQDLYFGSDDWLVKGGTLYADDNDMLSKRADFTKVIIRQQPDREIIVMTHGDFSHFLVNRWLYGPGCGTLFNGLKNATGIPMVLVENDHGNYEMKFEVPFWFSLPAN